MYRRGMSLIAFVVKATRGGRTTIPQELGEIYGIQEGDDLLVSDEGCKLVLRRIRRLETGACVDAGFGKVAELKAGVEKMRERY